MDSLPYDKEAWHSKAVMNPEKKRFYPDYLIEILFFIFVVIEVNVILALIFPPVIGREIDFTFPYQPRPEWYYLWLFVLLRYFYGSLTFFGGVILPALIIMSLFLIPFIDRYLGRTVAAGIIMGLTVFFVISIFIG